MVMDIKGKTVLVMGGWGLVGSAICRQFMNEHPKRLVVASLHKQEALEAVQALRKEFSQQGRNIFIPWWGNIFVREELKDVSREDILGNEKHRAMFIEDIVEELSEALLAR